MLKKYQKQQYKYNKKIYVRHQNTQDSFRRWILRKQNTGGLKKLVSVMREIMLPKKMKLESYLDFVYLNSLSKNGERIVP